MDDMKMSDNTKIWTWFRDNPDGLSTDCARQLGFFIKGDQSRPYYVKVSRAIKWMVREGYVRLEKCPLRGPIVKTVRPIDANKAAAPIDDPDLVNRVRDALRSGKTLAEIARAEEWFNSEGLPNVNRAWRAKQQIVNSDSPYPYVLKQREVWTVRDALSVIQEMLDLIPDTVRRTPAEPRTQTKGR